MKTILPITLASGFAAVTAFAIDAPPDNAPPPADVAPPASGDPAPRAAGNPVEKAAAPYLGVVSAGVPEMLADHLGLKAGDGVVVRAVMPDGPAEKAGLAVNDIITSVAGEPVGSSEELSVRIAGHKAGESIRLDIIHKGKPAGLDVTLGSRPDQLAAQSAPAAPQALDGLNLDGIPKELAERVRKMIEGNLGELKLDFENGVDRAAPQVEDAMRQMREQMGKAMQNFKVPDMPLIPQGGGGIQIHQGATFRLMDNDGSIELKSVEGGKEITVRDKDQKVVWSGPWDTEQDKAAAPENIRKRVERLNIDADANGLRLRLRDVPPPVDQE